MVITGALFAASPELNAYEVDAEYARSNFNMSPTFNGEASYLIAFDKVRLIRCGSTAIIMGEHASPNWHVYKDGISSAARCYMTNIFIDQKAALRAIRRVYLSEDEASENGFFNQVRRINLSSACKMQQALGSILGSL